MAVLQFPDGVDWDGHRVTLCVALAAHCDRHLRLLATLAMILADSANAARLRHADDVASVVSMLLGETNEITR
jgi:mannitol/fructose-specific phosphotransferase system IIA component